MITTIATGSQMDRITRCPASAALPQIHDAEPSDARDRGTAMHAFLERVPVVGRDAALAEVDERWRPFCSDIQLAKLADRMELSRELALAYNWRRDTARLLAPFERRAYEVDPDCEIPLTLDLAGAASDVVYVGDFKSGHGWLPDASGSMQLGLGALALARLHRASRAVIEYIRILDDGSSRRFDATLDVFGLEAIAGRVCEAMEEVDRLRKDIAAGATPTVTEGRWCRWCKAKQFCPAKTALIRHVLADPQPVPYILPLTPESALRAYRLLQPAKQALAQIEGALYAYAKLTPIPLGVEEDGSHRFFGELRGPGNEELSGAVTHQVLAELYGGEVANKAVSFETTKTAITDAIRAVLPAGEKITHHTEKVFNLVRDRGGARHKETVSTTEYSVDPEGVIKKRKRKAG